MSGDQSICMGCFVKDFDFNKMDKYGPTIILQNINEIKLTKEECEILLLLAQVWNKYLALPGKQPNDDQEFMQKIHDLQARIGLRVAQRVDVDVWKS